MRAKVIVNLTVIIESNDIVNCIQNNIPKGRRNSIVGFKGNVFAYIIVMPEAM